MVTQQALQPGERLRLEAELGIVSDLEQLSRVRVHQFQRSSTKRTRGEGLQQAAEGRQDQSTSAVEERAARAREVGRDIGGVFHSRRTRRETRRTIDD